MTTCLADDVLDSGDRRFGGIPEAPRGRRALARLLDAVAVLGSVPVLILLCLPMLAFIELIPVLLLVLVLSCTATATLWRAGRMPNGDRLSPGRLAAGLTVLRDDDSHRVVLRSAVQGPHRPTSGQVTAGRAAVGLAAVCAIGLVGLSGWITIEIVFQTQLQAARDAEWHRREPAAREVCDRLTRELLAGDPRGGEGVVAEAAAAQLAAYRDHVRDTGVTGFEQEGYGEGGGEWEYMLREVRAPGQGPHAHSISVMVRERGGRFVVTDLGGTMAYGEQ